MKIFLTTAIIAVIGSGSAFAQDRSSNNAESGATSQSTITFNQPSDTRLRSTPSAIAPGLTSSAVETCLGSGSLGGSSMGWGAALGITIKDHGCEARLDAKIMAQLGDLPAAKERLCDQKKMREAFLRAGTPCMADRQRVQYQQPTTRRMKIADMAPGTKYILNGKVYVKQ